ncbi:hypothetical protein K469DRAFT_622386, partial [Zopfia rhizophila CBS 207.26]
MASMNSHSNPSPLLCLPLEIRLIIYEYLLYPSAVPSSNHTTSVTNLLPDHHTYYSPDTSYSPFTLTVRTIDPYFVPHTSRTWRRRSTYHVRTGPFQTTTTPTTYRILLSPYTTHLRHTIPSLLLLNHQIHAEASKALYGTYTFNFSTSIEALVPFLSDLTPPALNSLRSLSLTKKPLPYTKEFDKAEWTAACDFLSAATSNASLSLRSLHLNIVAGRPGDEGWNNVVPIQKHDFEVLRRARKEWNADSGFDLEWVEQLMQIKGLKEVGVRAIVEHCPRPRSEMMAFWVAFSKSVEGGFAEWVRGVMVE